MAQRQPITRERLDGIAKNAAEAALQHVMRKTNARCGGADLTCAHCAADTEQINCKTVVKFKWTLSWQGVSIHTQVDIRADKAMYQQLLSPPKSWSYMLVAIAVPRAIDELGGLPWLRAAPYAAVATLYRKNSGEYIFQGYWS